MSEENYCFLSTMTGVCAPCALLHESTGQCKIVMLVNKLLGPVDGPVKATPPPPKPDSPLVADAMKGVPDMSQIEWLVKGNKNARDTDAFAYAFVFKYDATAKAATDELRPEAYELYTYLRENNNTLRIGEFTYSLNKTETLFARNKARD